MIHSSFLFHLITIAYTRENQSIYLFLTIIGSNDLKKIDEIQRPGVVYLFSNISLGLLLRLSLKLYLNHKKKDVF